MKSTETPDGDTAASVAAASVATASVATASVATASVATASATVHGLVDHLFRREASRMVALLTRSFGPARLSLAEEVVQEALIQALKRWPFHGIPENPRAWLYRVARNLALDRLRRDITFQGKEDQVRETLRPDPETVSVYLEGEITDDQLRLIFLCCHPELPRDARVALTLKTVCGFSVEEIARAFLSPKTTIQQRLVRAQRRIRERGIPFEVPPPSELPARLEGVLEALYLLFNEGYGAHDGDELVRSDLCGEALRLLTHLARLPAINRPEVHALASLLHFQASRLPARVDAEGNMMLLGKQDRSLWDRSLIARAFHHFSLAARGNEITEYHLQAAIAARHATASSVGETDWPEILQLYNQLHELNPSPIVALNRAVALAHVRGPRAGLDALSKIANHPAIEGYYLLPATRGEFHLQLGQINVARNYFKQALECPCSEPERRFLLNKIQSCQKT